MARQGSGPFQVESGSAGRRARLLRDAGALAAYLRQTLPQEVEPLPSTGPAAAAKVAAVLAPIYAQDGRPYLLFTRRSLALSRHRGEISFPGGSRDRTDGSLHQTALRETAEELGLEAPRVELLGALPSVFTSVSNYLIVPYVGWLGEGYPTLLANPSEVAEVIGAPLAGLANPAIYHTELWRAGGAEHLIHFYDYGAYRIWGATGRMLHSLLSLLPEE